MCRKPLTLEKAQIRHGVLEKNINFFVDDRKIIFLENSILTKSGLPILHTYVELRLES